MVVAYQLTVEGIESIADGVQQVTAVFVFGLVDVARIRHLHIQQIVNSMGHGWVEEDAMVLQDAVGQNLRIRNGGVYGWDLQLTSRQM